MRDKCVVCGKSFSKDDPYVLIAVDGVYRSGFITDLEPLFDSNDRQYYKNLFIHPRCERELREKLKSE